MPHLCIPERVIHEAQKSLINREPVAELPLIGLSSPIELTCYWPSVYLPQSLGNHDSPNLASGFSISQQ